MTEFPEDFFKRVVYNAKDIVWILSRDQEQVAFINHDYSGIEREKILDKGMSALWPIMNIKSLEALLAAFKKAVDTGEAIQDIRTQQVNPATRKDEFYQHTIIPIHSDDGTVSHIQVVSRDITAIHQAHDIFTILNEVSAEIQKKTTRDNILEFVGRRLKKHGIAITIGLMSEDGSQVRLAYTSIPKRKMKKAMSMVGIERIGEFVPSDKWALLPKLIRTRRPIFFDDPFTFLRLGIPDVDLRENVKEVVDLIDVGRIIYAPMIVDQRVIGTLTVISRNLTEMHLNAVQTFAAQFSHVLVQSKLHEETRKLRALLGALMNGLDFGLFIAERSGNILTWNRALRQLLGSSELDVIGKHVRTIGVDSALWEEICGECADHGGRWRGLLELKKGKGAGKTAFQASAFEVVRESESERGIACVLRRS